jgi:hypothetical protein
MEIVYCKCFCFRYYKKDGKKRLGFANPFAADETQVLPKGGENMEKRAYAFTVGGLVYGGVYFVLLLAATVVCLCLEAGAFTVYATLPYAAYLFLLNVIPAEYPTGKTDALIARGMKNGNAVEKTMLNVMRIHGELQSGKSYAEIDEEVYISAPQIAMDEPLYVAIMDARYRYFLELEEYEKAFDVLKRMKAAGEYMTDEMGLWKRFDNPEEAKKHFDFEGFCRSWLDPKYELSETFDEWCVVTYEIIYFGDY